MNFVSITILSAYRPTTQLAVVTVAYRYAVEQGRPSPLFTVGTYCLSTTRHDSTDWHLNTSVIVAQNVEPSDLCFNRQSSRSLFDVPNTFDTIRDFIIGKLCDKVI